MTDANQITEASSHLVCIHGNRGKCRECEKERAALRCEPRDSLEEEEVERNREDLARLGDDE